MVFIFSLSLFCLGSRPESGLIVYGLFDLFPYNFLLFGVNSRTSTLSILVRTWQPVRKRALELHPNFKDAQGFEGSRLKSSRVYCLSSSNFEPALPGTWYCTKYEQFPSCTIFHPFALFAVPFLLSILN